MKKDIELNPIFDNIIDESVRTILFNTIFEKIHSSSVRIKFTILIGCIFLSLPTTSLTVIVGIAFIIFAVLIQNIYGKNAVFYAAIIFSVFKRIEDYNEDEIDFIKARMFYSNYIDKIVTILNPLLLTILAFIMYFNGGIYSFIFFFGISFSAHFIALKSIETNIKLFDFQTDHFSDELIEEYNINFKNNNDFLLVNPKNSDFGAFIYLVIIIVYIKIDIFSSSTWEYVIISFIIIVLKITFSSRKYRFFIEDRFNKPKHPLISYVFSFHDLISVFCELIAVMFSTYYVLLHIWSEKFHLIYNIVVNLLIILSLMVLFNRYIFANTIIILLKQYLNDKYSILVFRKFSEINSSNNKNIVTPSLGAYGHVVTISDNTFSNSKSGITPDTESILSNNKDYIFCTDDNWQDRVLFELKKSNLVVFHWEGPPSENMLWELSITLELIPKSNILFITNPYIDNALNNALINNKEKFQLLLGEIHNIKIDVNAKDPLLLLHKTFKKELYCFMKKP